MNNETEYTVGQIADKFGEPPARIQYIISKYRLKPTRKVGIFRLFSESQLEAIKQGLYEIQLRGNK